MAAPRDSLAAPIFQFHSGGLGATGVSTEEAYRRQDPAFAIAINIFVGIRFFSDQPIVIDRVGGHFLGFEGGDTFFAAIVQLDGEQDLPDSSDLSTPDVLATSILHWPTLSAEVFADMSIQLAPGWHAVIFGSGLFGAEGNGAAMANAAEPLSSGYISWQPIVPAPGWYDVAPLEHNYRFVVEGRVVPEPRAAALAAALLAAGGVSRRRCGWPRR